MNSVMVSVMATHAHTTRCFENKKGRVKQLFLLCTFSVLLWTLVILYSLVPHAFALGCGSRANNLRNRLPILFPGLLIDSFHQPCDLTFSPTLAPTANLIASGLDRKDRSCGQLW